MKNDSTVTPENPTVGELVSNLAREALQVDGTHHKQWYLAMILKEVDAAAHYDYEQWGVDVGTPT